MYVYKIACIRTELLYKAYSIILLFPSKKNQSRQVAFWILSHLSTSSYKWDQANPQGQEELGASSERQVESEVIM